MQSLRTFLTVLILSVFYPSLLAEDVMEVVYYSKSDEANILTASTLTKMTDTEFIGSVTLGQDLCYYLRYGGKDFRYETGGEYSLHSEDPTGKSYNFTTSVTTGHIWNWNVKSYTIKATLSDNNTKIRLDFIREAPLYMSLDGYDKKVADNAIGVTGDIKYQSVISVTSGTKIINGFKVGDTMYGATSAVQFGDELTAQSRSTNLTNGGQAITLDKRGNYSISVRMTNGVPTQVTINKAEVVPDLKLNGNLLNYSNGIYSGQLSLTKGANVSLVYDNNTYYYIQSDMNGSLESPSGQVTLGTSNRGATVLTRGTYNVEVDIKALTLTYTNTTPPQPSTLSPTLPEGLVDYSSSSIYVPDEPMTLWYNEEKYANPTSVGNSEALSLEVFLLGNGRMGMTNICSASETFPIHEKTNYDAIISYDKPSSVGMGNYNTITNFTMNNDGESPTYGSQFIRQLDLTTAVASVISRWGDKAYAREYLVNRHYNVGAIHLTADGGAKLSYSFSNGLNGTSAGDGTVTVTTGNTTNCSIRFNVTFKVTQKGGTLSTNGSKVSVTDADEITFYFTIATNYDIDSSDYCYSGESDADLQNRALATVNKAAAAGWQAIYDDHIAEYSPLFNSVKFTLEDANNNAPVKDMKAHYEGRYSSYSAESDEHTRAVDMLLFGMGRYLNLASSRGDLDLPSNLQGIWADNNPRWDCDFHNNINQQMNYWAAEITNIPEAHMPMLNYMRKMSTKVWHNYAQAMIPGNDGWTIHGTTNTFGTSGLISFEYPEAAAWNCTHIWQHYLYTQDRQFLADFFDTLYGACKFFFAYLKDTDGDGQLEIPSNYSPEYNTASSVAVHAQQLVYQHLCNTRDAAKILGKNAEANMCQQYIDRMYNGIEIINGEQCEWKHTTPAATDHRHLSHLMCLYPLAQVSPYDDDRSNFNGAYQALLTRGDTDGGENAAWNTAWKMNCYARALEGDEALRQLAYGMKERITADLRTTCVHTFQIEGGAGISAGMAEMLLQSYSGVIDLLPALPESSWHGGSVSGLKAVGNYEVSIDWENNVMTGATIKDCVSQNMRSGTQIRVHTSRLEGGDINMLQINGVNAVDERNVMTRAASNRPTYAYEPTTESYLVTLPAISGNTAQVTFGDVSTGIEEIITDAAESDANAHVEYFDLYGRKVTNPSNGLFIRRQGNQVTKVIL